MSERPKLDSIDLSPVEEKYLSTCDPLPDRPFIEEANEWKKYFRNKSLNNESPPRPRSRIDKAFPHLGQLINKGFFDNRSLQSYFEGIDQDSHNMRMYLFAKRLAREHLPPGIMSAILEHVESCSVKVARIMASAGKPEKAAVGKIWSYGENYNAELDLEYLDPALSSPYVFIHGRTGKGLIVVRDAGAEFEPFKEWFVKRQKNGGGKLFAKK